VTTEARILLGLVEDITERGAREERIAHMAITTPLRFAKSRAIA